MVVLELSLKDFLYRKTLLLKMLEERLPAESQRKVKGDYHSRKKPRPCGVTVHSVIGCKYGCTYCYLPEMGVSFSNYHVYGLSGDEMSYALLLNPYFLPGRFGSLIAIGSVGEPFVDEHAFTRTLEYIHSFSKHLGNPTQFSTKAALSEAQVKALASVKLPLSPLVTVVSLAYYRKLEPNAPTPEKRFETIRLMRKNGLHPLLFLRPLIPGVNTEEIEEIVDEAKQAGAIGVVIGGLRITPMILERLEKAGFQTTQIRERVKGVLRRGVQLSVDVSDIKRQAVEVVREKGLVPFLSACCANNYTAMLYDGIRAPCPGLDYIDGRFCTLCPVQCPKIKTKIDPDEAREMIEKIAQTRVLELNIDDKYIRVKLEGKKNFSLKEKILIEVGYRRRVLLQ